MAGPTTSTRLCLLLVCVASARAGPLLEGQGQPLAQGSGSAAPVLVTVGTRVVSGGRGDGGGVGGGGFDGGVDNESVLDSSAGAADDLIFPTARKPGTTQLQQQQQQQAPPSQSPHHHHRGVHQLDSLGAEATATSTSCEESANDSKNKNNNEDDEEDDEVWEEYDVEWRNGSPSSTPSAAPLLDMRPFVALIPADEVRAIAAKYHRSDPEVQRAYAYLSGRDFVELRQRIVAVPEMAAFLRFLRANGLDVLGFLQGLTNLTRSAGATTTPGTSMATTTTVSTPSSSGKLDAIGANSVHGSDDAMEKVANSSPAPAPAPVTTSTAPTTTVEGATEAEQSLNGLHGLVDSVLDILPQDQILSTFFDKLESDERFARLIDNVSSPEFARILRHMENSVPLRNLIFTLHNNGIYITRIVDSLKAYFFLGGF